MGLFFLTKGGVKNLATAEFLQALGIPPIIIGLTIVPVATSAPELFTSIAAINSNAGGLVMEISLVQMWLTSD